MFKYSVVLTFAFILLKISCTTYQHNQHIVIPAPAGGHTSEMLTVGGWDGDFGVTWFPRCEFGGNVGGIVHGWPAKGGFYSKLFSSAELEFLGLDRFKPSNKSDNPEEEEAFCSKLRRLGAGWYRDPDHKLRAGEKLRNKDPDAPLLFIGWPADSDGVWALKTNLSQSVRRGLGRIGNAYNMEERCKMIEQLGGTYYADPKDCPHLDLDGSREEERAEQE
jgi:hypothetical protein